MDSRRVTVELAADSTTRHADPDVLIRFIGQALALSFKRYAYRICLLLGDGLSANVTLAQPFAMSMRCSAR